MIRSSGSVFRYVLMSFLLCGSCMLGQSSDAIAIQRYSEEGQKALASGRYDDAEKAYEKLRDLEPRTAEVHANLGLIYFQQRKFEQAVPTLREALKLKPSLGKSEALLAMSLSELGRYREALPGLSKALRDRKYRFFHALVGAKWRIDRDAVYALQEFIPLLETKGGPWHVRPWR